MPRNIHPLNDLFHVGREPTSAIVLSGAIGPYEEGMTVQDFLAALDVIIEGFNSDGFTLDAVIRRPITGIGAFGWVRRMSSPETDFANLLDAAYSGGTWVVVGDTDETAGQVYWTHDPEGTWNRQPGWAQLYYGDVATDGTTWAIVGAGRLVSGGPFGHLFTSPDPTVDHHWTQTLEVDQSLFGVYYANSHWITWGASGGGAALYTAGSTPTGTWTSRDTSAFDYPGPQDITFGNSTWVAISGSGATISTASTPTGTWTNQGEIGVPGANRIKYLNGFWVLVGARFISGSWHGGPWYATSPTGSWTEVTGVFGSTEDIVFDGTRYVAVGFNSTFSATRSAYATSLAGTWTTFTAPNLEDVRFLAYDGRVLVTGGVGQSEESAIETALSFSYSAFTIDAYIARKLTINAIIRRTVAASFTAAAVIKKTLASNFTIDAVLVATGGSFTLDAVMHRARTGSFTVNAFIPGRFTIDATITGFTIDAVIVSAMDSFQSDAFQDDTFQ